MKSGSHKRKDTYNHPKEGSENISSNYSSIPIQKNLQNLLKDKEKLENIKSMVSPDTSYTKLKFKSVYYSVGDKLIIFASNENLIGELIKIIPTNGIKRYPCWPTIEVRWYYKKTDLNRKKNNLIDERNYNSISDYELFPTEHKDVIFIETVIGKCDVYTYEEYEALDDHTETTFFSRAKYDPKNQLLIPRFDDWSKGCVCQRPLNPDQLYIKCDGCNGWFHPECCGLTEEQADKINSFYCPGCKGKRY